MSNPDVDLSVYGLFVEEDIAPGMTVYEVGVANLGHRFLIFSFCPITITSHVYVGQEQFVVGPSQETELRDVKKVDIAPIAGKEDINWRDIQNYAIFPRGKFNPRGASRWFKTQEQAENYRNTLKSWSE